MKYKDYRNDLLDAGDFNDIPEPTATATLLLSWMVAAVVGASAVLFAIGGTL